MDKHKILILKTGYSEVLDGRNNSRLVSLGDVLRTTPLLNAFKNDSVTWVTDLDAFPLLEGNPHIHKLLPYDFTTALQLRSEEFDTVINLEKVPGICALSDEIRSRRNRYGFTFNSQTGEAEAYDKAIEVLAVGADPKLKKINNKNCIELLFEMIGRKWKGEEYILGYVPKSTTSFDVALNVFVGQKWPTKSWPDNYWNQLEDKLGKEGLTVTRQDKQSKEVLSNLKNYMDWIGSARLIVSNDSLGLHLGIALRKKVIGLFGPTPSKEVYFYNRGEAVTPPKLECIPCFKPTCDYNGLGCMREISPETVFEKVLTYTDS